MKGRFIIDQAADTIYVFLRDHEGPDIVNESSLVDLATHQGLVTAFYDKDGAILGVEIILPKDKRSDS